MAKRLFIPLYLFLSVTAGAAQEAKPRLALSEFRTGGGVTREEAAAALDLLQTELVGRGTWEVVDRKNLARILKEHSLQQSGILDEGTAVRMGRIAGAQYLVYGTLQKVGQVFFLTADVVSVESAQVVKSARDKFARMEDLGDSVKKLANDISGITQKRNTAVFVKKGHGLLSVKTDPPGAQVFVGDSALGETELLAPVPVGVARIKVTRRGYLPMEVEEVIKEGQVHEISMVLTRGVGLEEALADRERLRKEWVGHAVATGVSAGVLATSLLIASGYNDLGRQRYALYQDAVTPDAIGQARTEYQNAFGTADGLYYLAEGATVVGAVFLVLTVVDLIRLDQANRRVEHLKRTADIRLVPGISPSGLSLAFVAPF